MLRFVLKNHRLFEPSNEFSKSFEVKEQIWPQKLGLVHCFYKFHDGRRSTGSCFSYLFLDCFEPPQIKAHVCLLWEPPRCSGIPIAFFPIAQQYWCSRYRSCIFTWDMDSWLHDSMIWLKFEQVLQLPQYKRRFFVQSFHWFETFLNQDLGPMSRGDLGGQGWLEDSYPTPKKRLNPTEGCAVTNHLLQKRWSFKMIAW